MNFFQRIFIAYQRRLEVTFNHVTFFSTNLTLKDFNVSLNNNDLTGQRVVLYQKVFFPTNSVELHVKVIQFFYIYEFY